ncbi:hypothetical protein R3P38DRAFT_3219381 [Favolaschia claudopus]|uniref:Transposase n=1 Tax=Favolaschia claudopus TaxID=2862362 RepID=A0AAW0A4D3_9AGAR
MSTQPQANPPVPHRETQRPHDLVNLQTFPDRNERQRISLARYKLGGVPHWAIIWPVWHINTPADRRDARRPDAYKTVEIVIEDNQYKFRLAIRRANESTARGWTAQEVGSLDLASRQTMIRWARQDPATSAVGHSARVEAGGCRDCVERILTIMAGPDELTTYLDIGAVLRAIKEAKAAV